MKIQKSDIFEKINGPMSKWKRIREKNKENR